MKNSGIANKDTTAFGKTLQALLFTAFSLSNLEPFLRKVLDTLSGPGGFGRGAGLAVVLDCSGAGSSAAFRNIPAAERRLMGKAHGVCPLKGKKGQVFVAPVMHRGTKAGYVLARAGKSGMDGESAKRLVETAAMIMEARLANEERDSELNFERDLAAAVKHVEELYLAFPGISIEEISRAVLDEARRMTGSPLGFTGYIDPASGQFLVPAITHDAIKTSKGKRALSIAGSESLPGWVIRHKKHLIKNAIPSNRKIVGLPHGYLKIDRFLGVPAMSGRKLLGIIVLANSAADYSAEELETAQKLGRVYALMLRHKLAEQQKQADDAKYKSILDTSSDLIFNMTVDGTLTYVSRAIEIYGYCQDEVLGRHFQKFIHPEDRGRLGQAFTSGVKAGRSLIPLLTYRLRRKDGSYATIEQKNSVIPRPGTAPIITGIIRDVTASRRAAEQLAESELKYKTIFDKANAAILIADAKTGTIVDANKDAEKLTGRTREELLGMNRQKLHPKENAKHYKDQFREHARNGVTTLAEAEVVRKDGSHAQVLISTSKLLLRGREALQGIFHDVTAQRQTERILRDLVEKNPLAIQILDKDGFTLKVNMAFTTIFGAVPPPGFSIFNDPQLKEQNLDDLFRRVKKGEVVNFPVTSYNVHTAVPGAPDKLTWIRAVIFPLCDETGKPERFVIMHEDITARKLAEDRQRDEDARFKAIISASKDIIYTADLNGKLTYISPRVRDYGFEPEDLLGRGVTEFAHPEDKEFVQKAFANAIKTYRTLPILPYRNKRKDGTYFYAEQKSGIVFADGKPSYLTGVIRDVTEQKRTETRLKESEELMRMVFETAEDAIFIKDLNGMYVKANGACAHLMRTTPEGLIGHTDAEYLPAETAEKIFLSDSEVVRAGKTLSLNNFHPFPAGSRHVNIIKTPLRNIKGEIIGLLGVARDITDLKRTEAELALARASQAVSDVARPMAHDFNNALAAINGYATLIDDDLNETSPIKTEIAQIIKAVKRAAELTSKFQAFARDPKITGKGDGNAE